MPTSTLQGNPRAFAMEVAKFDVIREEGLIERVTDTIEQTLERFGRSPGTRVVGAPAAISLKLAGAEPIEERTDRLHGARLEEGLPVCRGADTASR